MRRWSALLGVAALCAALAASGAATPVTNLRERQAALASRQSAATLELYALQSRLARAESQLAGLRARREATEAQLMRLRIEVDVALQSLYVAQERLGARIRQLYEHGRTDPVAILLGAQSLDEAVDGLESLRHLAAGDRDLLRVVRRARTQVAAAKQRVSARAAALREAESRAAATAASLRAAAAERSAYLAQLRRHQGFTRRQIARAQAIASAAAAKSSSISAPTAPAPVIVEAPTAEATPVPGGRELTVEATGYALVGRTATGIPTAWGVVAVDPSVIPLGTRMTIPGYGDGIAADTGGAVRGNVIDLWFPTREQALAWGRRTVTITLHG